MSCPIWAFILLNKNLKSIVEIAVLVLILSSAKLSAQFADAPAFKLHEWTSLNAFDAAQDTVQAVSKWLCETPISWQYERRSSANVYVLNWMTGHPSKKWELSTDCFGPLDDHLELLYSFLHANLYFTLVHEKASVASKDIYVMQVLTKKILWSDRYRGEKEWKNMVRSVQMGKEKKYLAQCYSKTKQPVG